MRAAAEPSDRAVGEHDFKAQDIVAGHSILEAARAAGVGGNISAEGAIGAAGRVRRIKEANFFDCILQILGFDSGLDNGNKIAAVNFLNLLHALERNDDAAADGHATADVTIAGPARGNGDSMLVGKA